MAGTVVHHVIADMLSQEWHNTKVVTPYGSIKLINNYFIAGNICPDGIMARDNYVRDMKKHTHFRNGIKDCDFHIQENLQLFRHRLDSFMKENLETIKEDNERSLYLGYWVHMLADEMFMLQIRPEFLKNISVTGLTEKNMETFKYFSKDVDAVDFRLVNEYEGTRRIYNALASINPYEIYGMVTKDELTRSRRWIIDYFFETKHTGIKDPVYISYNRMQEFIRKVVEDMVKIFYKEI